MSAVDLKPAPLPTRQAVNATLPSMTAETVGELARTTSSEVSAVVKTTTQSQGSIPAVVAAIPEPKKAGTSMAPVATTIPPAAPRPKSMGPEPLTPEEEARRVVPRVAQAAAALCGVVGVVLLGVVFSSQTKRDDAHATAKSTLRRSPASIQIGERTSSHDALGMHHRLPSDSEESVELGDDEAKSNEDPPTVSVDKLPAAPATAQQRAAWFTGHQPTESEDLTRLGDAAFRKGDWTTARATYKRALDKNPSYLPARIGVANVAWEQGDRNGARTNYQAIVDDTPSYLVPSLVRQRANGTAVDKPRLPRR